MLRRVSVPALLLVLGTTVGAYSALPPPTPGSAGVGDDYFPLLGNGGYDVRHYGLAIDYRPETDVLKGVATIQATATQALSSFNLDLDGLTVRSVRVDGAAATWTRDDGELTVTPARPLDRHERFTTVVRYDGVPVQLPYGPGVVPTDDGTLILGEPEGASTWFPANDHPVDKAPFTVAVTVPRGLEAIGNGALESVSHQGDSTTWTWDAREPMAPYLATASIGEFDVSNYRDGGLRYWDAVDPDLFDQPAPAPRTGSQYAWSQQAYEGASYKRLSRTIAVPAASSDLTFWVDRQTEEGWDFFFVEARPTSTEDWTTLRDANGHTTQDTGFSCPFWLGLHPFLAAYQTDVGDGTCEPSGSTGDWWAATGTSDGYEQWRVDLSGYAGSTVEVSLTYASDDVVQDTGVFVDDVTVSTGEGSTSFESDSDPLDGWQVTGPPEGSQQNENDWIATPQVELQPIGERVAASLARQPEIIAFLESQFGRYPFSTAGGVVDDLDVGFALENQTRPVYSPGFWSGGQNDDVVVHEIAHQWYGDDVAVARWQHIWLNEGFASYAEWLWSEHDGRESAQEIFDFFFEVIPADDPFWDLTIGDPGPDALFDGAVYLRGAMTLHALRLTIGDGAFFKVMRAWARHDPNGTTEQFVELAEKVSGRSLDALFDEWLFTSGKPSAVVLGKARVRARAARGGMPAVVKSQLTRAAMRGR